jgi:septum formation protein
LTAPLVLASTSPQRRWILEQLGIRFEIVAPDYEEHDPPDADPVELVRRHAVGKAQAGAAGRPERVVLGVDTTVVLGGRIFAKAADAAEAKEMLAGLAGRTHQVVSGLCLIGPGFESVGHETTSVTFRPLSARELDAYLATGEWEGRAGAYAVQGRGAGLVARIEGEYLNVVGLPATRLLDLLGQRFPALLPSA